MGRAAASARDRLAAARRVSDNPNLENTPLPRVFMG